MSPTARRQRLYVTHFVKEFTGAGYEPRTREAWPRWILTADFFVPCCTNSALVGAPVDLFTHKGTRPCLPCQAARKRGVPALHEYGFFEVTADFAGGHVTEAWDPFRHALRVDEDAQPTTTTHRSAANRSPR